MKLLALEAENVKRLKAIHLTFEDGLIVIGGRNGAGKSSCLDAVAMALGGKALVCEQPLQKGETKGHVSVILGEPDPAFKITRRFSAKGTTSLTIEAADGSRPGSPQALLDSFLGTLSFDPLAFGRMEPKRQSLVLRDLVGLDISEMEAEAKQGYEQRTVAGREVSRLEGALGNLAHHPEAPASEISVDGLAEEFTAANEQNNQRAKLLDGAASQGALGTEHRKRVDALRREVEQLGDLAEEADTQAARLKADAEAITVQDLEAIREKMRSAEAVNLQVRENARRKSVSDQLAAAREVHAGLERKIEALRDQRDKAIRDAQFPIEGLAVDEQGVVYAGLPFAQASQAEQLRISVAMGLALNPRLKLLLIYNGSLLDAENLQMIADMADEAGAQILMERVGKDAHTSVVIEDGMVQE